MSETVTIKIYYGIGEIIYGPQGVYLSNYSSIEKNVPRAAERTWEAITNGLVRAFSVDLEHQMHVGDGTNQQKYTSVLRARGT
jgi:hypothetical protein